MTRVTSFASSGHLANSPSSVFVLSDLGSIFHDPLHDVHLCAHRSCHFGRRRHDLAGLIGKGVRGAPDEPEPSEIEIVSYGPITQDVERRQDDRPHLLPVIDQMIEAASRVCAVWGVTDDGLHRIGLWTVPVNVEDASELTNDGT